MDRFRKHRTDIGIFAFFAILYFFTRLYNILLLPIFTDESIYIYWAKTIVTTHAHWFISLSDGKPPLLIWMISLLLSIFPSDLYLLAGRLPSVISGFLALIAIYKLTYLLFKDKIAPYIAVFLYIVTPFTLFYDRMALFDSLLCAMILWTVYFSIKTAHTLAYKDAVVWGIFLGLGFLTKPPAVLFLMLTPLCFFLFADRKKLWVNKKRLFSLLALPLFISLSADNIQRLSGAYPLMTLKNRQFQYPISEVLADPLLHIPGNIHGLSGWFIDYMTVTFFAACFMSAIILVLFKKKEGLALFALWFLPLSAFAIVGREIFPRYILFVVPYFIIPPSFLFSKLMRKSIIKTLFFCIILIAILYQALNFDRLILTNPAKAPLTETDYNQYIADHPSGYGLDRIFSFIHTKAKTQKVTVVTQGTFGLYPYAFELEFWNDPNVQIIGKWPLLQLDKNILNAKKTRTVYVIFKEETGISPGMPLKLILKAEKPTRRHPIYLTELVRIP